MRGRVWDGLAGQRLLCRFDDLDNNEAAKEANSALMYTNLSDMVTVNDKVDTNEKSMLSLVRKEPTSRC